MDANALARWLEDRLTSDQGHRDYLKLVDGAIRHALAVPLAELLPEATLVDALEAHLSPERLADAARLVVRQAATRAVAEARADDAPTGRWLSDDAKLALEGLVARPGWVDRAWIDQLFKEKAMEAIVSDTLYRALVDFSTLVPRVVQGVMPSGLGKLAKLGGKATGGVGGRLVEEVEKRLEGEIKRFLAQGTRRALEGAAAFTADRIDSPESVAARKDLLTFGLARSPAFHAQPLDAEALAEIEAAAVAVATSVGAHAALRPLARDVVAKVYEDLGDKPLADALAEAGVDVAALPTAAWAEASWPAVRAVIAAPETRTFLTTLSQEILEALEKQ